MQTAKIFKSGETVAVRIPRAINLDGIKEFAICQTTKNEIILTTVVNNDKYSELDTILQDAKKINFDIEPPQRLPPTERA
ncbi:MULTISPECIES: hypothetical protein [unclassified Campylobacter]|uniref:hypothetical protein n=1 Tax=unclassified Campylobacter TaxID=2593542 RepID=UPI003D344A79